VAETGLNCMCCRTPVPPDKVKLFAQVFCCETCYAVAERFMQRAIADLDNLRVVLTDVIRHGLLTGQLQFRTEQPAEPAVDDVLTEVVRLAQTSPQWTRRSSTTSLPAVPAVGCESSSSSPAAESE